MANTPLKIYRSDDSHDNDSTSSANTPSASLGSESPSQTQSSAAPQASSAMATSAIMAEGRVTVKAGDFLQLMSEANQGSRSWLSDFRDDEIIIPRDLYDVLLAYQRMQRHRAA